jgi:hypothetical protein
VAWFNLARLRQKNRYRRRSYQISRIVTDPPSVAGARIRALGCAALAAGAIRRLGRVPRPQVLINGIRYQ